MTDRFERFVDPGAGMAPSPGPAPTQGLPASSGQVYVTGSDGSVYMVPEEDLPKVVFEDAGARLSTAGELREVEQKAKYGGGNTTLEAIDRAAGRGFAGPLGDFGLTRGARLFAGNKTAQDISHLLPEGTPWQQILSGDEEAVAERLKGIEEQHSTASAIGEAAGFGAGLLLPGPNVAKGIAGIGRMTEAGLAKVLGEGVLAKWGTAAARTAAENYAFGVSDRLDEAVLGDPNLNAEKIFTEGAGLDLLVGAGLGGAFHGGGLLFSGGKRLTGKAVDSVAEKLFGEAARAEGKGVGQYVAEDLRGKGQEWLVKGAGLMSGADPQVIETFFGPKGAEKRAMAVFGAEAERMKAIEGIRQGMDDLGIAMPELTDEFKGPFKQDYISKLVRSDNPKEAYQMAMDHLRVLNNHLDEIDKIALRDVRGQFASSMDTLRKWSAMTEEQINRLATGGERDAASKLEKSARLASEGVVEGRGWDPGSVQKFLEKHLPGRGGAGAEAATKQAQKTAAGISYTSLTPEAEELLAKAEAGGIPLGINNNFKRILRENGIEYSDKMRGQDAIEQLRARKRTPIPGRPVPDFSDDPIVQEMKRRVEVDKKRVAGTVNERVKPQVEQPTRQLPDVGRAPTMVSAGQGVEMKEFLPTKDFNARVYMSLDSMKRVAQAVSNMRYEMIPDAINRQNAMRIHDAMVRFSEGLRSDLENPQVWGKAAEKQKEINGLWSRHIMAEKEVKRGLMREMQDIANPKDPFKRRFIGDPDKIGRFLHDIVAPEKDLVRGNFRDYVSSAKQLAEALRSLDLPPEKVKMFEKAVAAASKLEGTFEDALKKIAVINQYEKLTGSGNFLPALAGMGAGRLLGFGPGLLVGGVAELLANPKKGIRMLAHIERIHQEHFQGITEGIRNWLKGSPAKATRRSLDSKQITQAVDRIAKLNGSADISEEIANALKLPEEFGQAAPNTQFAIGATAARVVSFLLTSLPKQPQSTSTALPYKPKPIGDLLSDMEKHTLNLRVRVALKGSRAVVDDLQENRLMVQSVLALQAMYPQEYDELKKVMMNEIIESNARGEWEKIPYQRRQALSVVFQMPLDYSQSPEFARSLNRIRQNPPSVQIQQMEEQQQQMQPQPGRPSGGKVDDSFSASDYRPVGDRLQQTE